MHKGKIRSEIIRNAVRSSGSGGQHVNKVATKAQIRFHVADSEGLSDAEKKLITENLSNRISHSGHLMLSSQSTRSLLKNKELAISKLFKILKKALYVKPKRKKRKRSKAAHLKRLENKKRHSEKKASRKPIQY